MRPTTVTLDLPTLYLALRKFEDAWAERTGDAISSAAFYEMYRMGKVDTPFAALWATFFEILERKAEEDGAPVDVDDALLALA